jgi:hypothetical protein
MDRTGSKKYCMHGKCVKLSKRHAWVRLPQCWRKLLLVLRLKGIYIKVNNSVMRREGR